MIVLRLYLEPITRAVCKLLKAQLMPVCRARNPLYNVISQISSLGAAIAACPRRVTAHQTLRALKWVSAHRSEQLFGIIRIVSVTAPAVTLAHASVNAAHPALAELVTEVNARDPVQGAL